MNSLSPAAGVLPWWEVLRLATGLAVVVECPAPPSSPFESETCAQTRYPALDLGASLAAEHGPAAKKPLGGVTAAVAIGIAPARRGAWLAVGAHGVVIVGNRGRSVRVGPRAHGVEERVRRRGLVLVRAASRLGGGASRGAVVGRADVQRRWRSRTRARGVVHCGRCDLRREEFGKGHAALLMGK